MDRHHVPEILRRSGPLFFNSPEYQDLDEDLRPIGGLLIAAFTRYSERMVREGNNPEVEACLAAVEQLASSKDPEVLNSVYTDFLDNLKGDDAQVARLVDGFGPKSRAAYEDWLKRWNEAAEDQRRSGK